MNLSTSPGYKNKCKYSTGKIDCENVHIKDIKEFFKQTDNLTSNLLDSIKLTLLPGDEFIPENILGNKTTKELEINYDYICQDRFPSLKVDVNAFQSTKNQTKDTTFKNFGGQLDLSFLSGFNRLASLTLYNIRHVQKSLLTLPHLPELTSLILYDISWLNHSIVTFPNLSTGGLISFVFRNYDGVQIDYYVSQMLDWVLLSSAKTLQYLELRNIGIKQIPSQISSFTELKHLNLDGNSISTIKTGALSFSVPALELRLSNNKISLIEPGAFQGK